MEEPSKLLLNTEQIAIFRHLEQLKHELYSGLKIILFFFVHTGLIREVTW